MSQSELPDADLWHRILADIATRVPAGCFDTWFRPLQVQCRGTVLHLAAPNETFRAFFADHYLGLTSRVAAEVAGTGIQLGLSVCDGEASPAPGTLPEGRVQPLPVVRAADLETPVYHQPWLIEQLWTHQAVGVIGGSPKSGKTWLALEMAVAVASGSPCLGTFAIPAPGPVLIYAAEESATALRSRIEALARRHQLHFQQLEVHIITLDALRLDRPEHQDRLEATLQLHRPALLVLDPLVRIHAIDENVAGQVAALLGYLRCLQRKTGTAIALIHHIRKNASPTAAAGYCLRGSGDLYAWLDSFLYLRMHQGQRTLSAEHRSAPAFGPVTLELAQSAGLDVHLRIASDQIASGQPPPDDLPSRILQLLSDTPEPLTVDTLRSRLQVRNQRVVRTLHLLVAQGKVQRHARGFSTFQPSTPYSQLSV